MNNMGKVIEFTPRPVDNEEVNPQNNEPREVKVFKIGGDKTTQNKDTKLILPEIDRESLDPRLLSMLEKAEADMLGPVSLEDQEKLQQKMEEFLKLKISFNKTICKEYLEGFEDVSIVDLVKIAMNLSFEDFQARPAYAVALFKSVLEKLKKEGLIADS